MKVWCLWCWCVCLNMVRVMDLFEFLLMKGLWLSVCWCVYISVLIVFWWLVYGICVIWFVCLMGSGN